MRYEMFWAVGDRGDCRNVPSGFDRDLLALGYV